MNHGQNKARETRNSPKLNLWAWMQPHKPNTESLSWYFQSYQRLIHQCKEWIGLHDLWKFKENGEMRG
jgi:hypothetical protein